MDLSEVSQFMTYDDEVLTIDTSESSAPQVNRVYAIKLTIKDIWGNTGQRTIFLTMLAGNIVDTGFVVEVELDEEDSEVSAIGDYYA